MLRLRIRTLQASHGKKKQSFHQKWSGSPLQKVVQVFYTAISIGITFLIDFPITQSPLILANASKPQSSCCWMFLRSPVKGNPTNVRRAIYCSRFFQNDQTLRNVFCLDFEYERSKCHMGKNNRFIKSGLGAHFKRLYKFSTPP